MPPRTPPLAKLTRPTLEGAVARERLFARLDECLRSPLVWIVGPPGAGKTTLASTYFAARKTKHLWIQLDATDSDPASFFFYLRAACEGAGLSRKHLPPLLTREYLDDVPGFARRTFRGLFAHFRVGLTLALDNYQEIGSDSLLHRALAEACEEIPRGSHLLVLSRIDPPAEYVRLVASERLARIEWEDLKLTREEVQAFGRSRAVVSDAAIDSLYRSCAGWAAGFTLLREQLARTGLVDDIDTSEGLQTVFDYFAAEVLCDTSAENRQILMETSLMPRFSAAMAIAVTGKTAAPQLLQWLHQRHLFTDRRLSGKEVFYQYHSLFRSFLKARAERHLAPEALASLARRSAHVLEDNGQAEDAVELLIAAGEYERAAVAVLRLAPMMVATGRGQAFLTWASELPETVRNSSPWLDYWRGQALMGPRLREARAAFEQADAGFGGANDRAGRALSVVGVLETYFHELDDLRLADPWVARLPELFEPEPDFGSVDVAALAYQALVGFLLWIRPDVELLDTCAVRLERLLEEPLSTNVKLLSAAQLADFHSRDRPERAGRFVKMAEQALDEPEVTPVVRLVWYARTGWYHLVMADFELLLGNVRRARTIAVENGFEQFLTWILGFEADIASSLSDEESLRSLIAAYQDHLPTLSKQGLGRYLHTCAKLHCLRGEWEEARRFAQETYRLAREHGFTLARVAFGAFLAMILVELGDFDGATALARESDGVYSRARFPLYGMRVPTTQWIVARARGDTHSWREPLQAYLRDAHERGARTIAMGNSLRLSQRLFEMALETGIEVDFVRAAIRAARLPPRRLDVADWPWPLRLHALGAFSVRLDDKPLTFDGKVPRKPLELLHAIVALGGARVSSEALCCALWPDAEADAGVVSLRVTLSRLRKLLGEADLVQSQDGKLSLDRRRCYVDVWALDALLDQIERSTRTHANGGLSDDTITRLAERLLALYTGPFLRDEREQPWMLPLREKLKSRFVRATMALGERLEAAELTGEALGLYERALAQEPTAERIYRRMMAIQLGEGRKSEAMITYRRCRDMLSIVLGTRPDAETEALHRTARAAGSYDLVSGSRRIARTCASNAGTATVAVSHTTWR